MLTLNLVFENCREPEQRKKPLEPDDNEVMGSKCTAVILSHGPCGFAAFPSTPSRPDPQSGHGYGNFDRF